MPAHDLSPPAAKPSSVNSAHVKVFPVTSRSHLRRFIDLPYRLYRDNPFWVPQLRVDQKKIFNPRKNPFFEHGKIQPFLAQNNAGEVVGRIAAIVNGMHLKKYEDGNGFFGFFESVDDSHVAGALLDAASDWLRSQGLTGVRGPANPSMNDIAGLLVDGFESPPTIMMPYNYPYYESLLLQYGFSRAITMWAYFIHEKYADLDRARRGTRIVLRRNPDVKLRTIDMDRYHDEAQTILDIYNQAWAENWGNVPMTKNEFRHLAKDMKAVIDPNIVYIVEDKGRPVAFSISLPNINHALMRVKNGRLFPFGLLHLLLYTKIAGIHDCRTILMGVLPEYRGRGLDALMHAQLMLHRVVYGYTQSELSWVLESNRAMVNTAEAYGTIRDKEYAMFEKSLV